MSEDDDTDKQHEASQKRLEEARKKGEIARSTDLTTAASYAGLLIAAYAMGPDLLKDAGAAAAILLDQPEEFATQLLSGGSAQLAAVLGTFGWTMAPFFLFPAIAALASVLAQRALVFTPEKLAPKLSRISPIAAAKNKFGRAGLFEFGKSFAKLAIISILLGAFLMRRAGPILGTLYLSPALGTGVLLGLLVEFLFLIVLIAGSIGGIDYLWQRMEHLRRHRMSRQDMIDEHKESDGDPHAKAQRRQRGYDIATNRMLADVATADVIVVNPTHYAVALKWDRAAKRAPVCVAKGVDEIAARIREIAAESGIPMHRDPPTARALHASVDIGQEIRAEHYRAVAAAIRFAEAMRRRARRRR